MPNRAEAGPIDRLALQASPRVLWRLRVSDPGDLARRLKLRHDPAEEIAHVPNNAALEASAMRAPTLANACADLLTAHAVTPFAARCLLLWESPSRIPGIRH